MTSVIVSSPLTITLREDTPLYFLNQVFPNGVPVKDYILSLNDEEFYEFSPQKLPDQTHLVTLAKTIATCPPTMHYALGMHHIIAIPVEWVKEATT